MKAAEIWSVGMGPETILQSLVRQDYRLSGSADALPAP